jgi:alpha-beta hydrolase superfamily lysophospholipase
MLRKAFLALRARPKRALLCLTLLASVAMNVLAYRHAWLLTHFVGVGDRPPSPEVMTLWQKAEAALCGVQIPKPRNAKTPADYELPFEARRFVTRDGLECAAWRVPCPDGQRSQGLCLLFHGFANAKDSMLPAARAFHEFGYDTLLVDFRGSGESDGHSTTIGYREADDVAAACAYAERQWPDAPILLYGRSMGSVAILRAIATQQVRPTALMLEAPFDRLLGTTRNRCRTAGLPAFPLAELLVFWGGVQHGYSGFAHNPVAYAKAVECPTLLLHGDCDIRVSPAEARQVFDRLPGKNTWALLAGAGHENLAAKHHAEWLAAVEGFLSEIAPKRRAENLRSVGAALNTSETAE